MTDNAPDCFRFGYNRLSLPEKDIMTDHQGTPPAEIEVSEELVRALLEAQHPDLAELPLTLFENGWDNVMYRLGRKLLLRLPRRALAAPLVGYEQDWLPQLAPGLPLPVPAPLRIGLPGAGYPWRWSVLPFLPGRPADWAPPGPDEGPVLGEFLLALHRPAPAEAPPNEFRGVPLAERRAVVETRLARLKEGTEAVTGAVEEAWRAALAAPPSEERLWLHGDLHARNVLTDGECFSAVIDWGDITSGDAATDLAAIWMLLPEAKARAEALKVYEPSAARLARAKGWAVSFGTVLLETGLTDNPRHADMGAAILARLHQDVEAGL